MSKLNLNNIDTASSTSEATHDTITFKSNIKSTDTKDINKVQDIKNDIIDDDFDLDDIDFESINNDLKNNYSKKKYYNLKELEDKGYIANTRNKSISYSNAKQNTFKSNFNKENLKTNAGNIKRLTTISNNINNDKNNNDSNASFCEEVKPKKKRGNPEYFKNKQNKNGAANNKNAKTIEKISFQIISKTKVLVDSTYFMENELIKICKKYCTWENTRKKWETKIQQYSDLFKELSVAASELNSKKDYPKHIIVEDIPHYVIKCTLNASQNTNLTILKTSISTKGKSVKIEIDYSEDSKRNYSISNLSEVMKKDFFSFQKKGVQFGIERKGRFLLADEMGVGKTAQALGVMYVYKEEWPVLVICPSSLKYNWKNEIVRWTGINESKVHIINKGSDDLLPLNTLFTICSYEIATKSEISSKIEQQKFKCLIADEAHALKNKETKRCKVLLPILKQIKRLICISGTPILAKPIELFSVVSCIRPDLFNNYHAFANRYCNPRETFYGIDYKGTSNLRELNYILENFMIRRLKKEVLSELPDKQRQKIEIPVDTKLSLAISHLKRKNKEGFENAMNSFLINSGQEPIKDHFINKNKFKYKKKNNDVNNNNEITEDEFNDNDESSNEDSEKYRKGKDLDSSMVLLYNKAYLMTGEAKIEGINNYVNYLIEEDVKFLLFAHHSCVMEKLEANIKQQQKHYKDLEYIKIDGNVPPKNRQERVDYFQSNSKCRIALLSITACATGLTLTEASLVVFAELFFTPSIMIQAEDRAHRIGQKNNVQIKYMIGQNTLDEEIFEALNDKLGVVTETLDDCKKDMEVQKHMRLSLDMLNKATNRNKEKREAEINGCSNEDANKPNLSNNKFLKTVNKDKSNNFDDTSGNAINRSKSKNKKKFVIDKSQSNLDLFLMKKSKNTNNDSNDNNNVNNKSKKELKAETRDNIINSCDNKNLDKDSEIDLDSFFNKDDFSNTEKINDNKENKEKYNKRTDTKGHIDYQNYNFEKPSKKREDIVIEKDKNQQNSLNDDIAEFMINDLDTIFKAEE